jgi:hypothetical protein
MANSTDIIIKAPRQGIATSPHIGFGDVRNIDFTTIAGVTMLNTIAVKLSSTVVTSQINWLERNPNTINPSVLPIVGNPQIFALADSGTLYNSRINEETYAILSGNSTSSAHGNGMRIWKDYLFIARDSSLDTFGPLAGMTFTVTVASPAIFTTTSDHGLVANDTVIFSTTGALPTGLSTNTVYYVIAAGLTNDDFEISATQGGAAINTSGTQSGTHTLQFWKSTNAFKTIDTDILWHPMLVSKNDSKLYGGAGRYVFSLDETTGQTFNPGLSATFSFSQQALDLPPGVRIKSLEELGGYLMCGTWQGSNVTDFPIADIYPWDRSSSSFGQPVVIKEFGCHALLNVGGSLICLVGTKGSIYRCDGANAYLIGRLPINLTSGTYIEWYPGSICFNKDKVFFGSGGSATLANQGVYSLEQTAKGNILSLEHLNSQLTDGSAAVVKTSAIIPSGNRSFYIGWRSDTSYGIDAVSTTSYAYSTDYSGFFDSPLFIVSSADNLREFSKLKIQFAKKLATGEGIKIFYRTNLTDSFVVLGNAAQGVYSFSTIGATFSHFDKPGLPKCEMLQIRVALLGTSTTTPQLKSVIFS